ncbi:hypothetical protein [Kitasatospora sp. NPDC059803]|uniref:hypothetical protein n=1 Tax=Kitasatospora sp. NPDC059803 TaxID=3346953 RepID=UPI00366A23E1
MEEFRREIRDALEGAGAEGAIAAPQVLRAALSWVCTELRTLDAGPGGSTALAVLYELDDALSAAATLADAVPELLDAARAGASLRGGVAKLTDRLAQVGDLLATERTDLTDLLDRQEELRRRLADHAELRRQVDELRRLERIVAALDGLGEQQATITARLLQLRGKDAGVEDALRISAERLLQLSEEQLAVLAPQTRQALARAEQTEAALAAEQRTFDSAQQRLALVEQQLADLQGLRDGQLAALRLHAQTDAELARALAGSSSSPDTAETADRSTRSALAEAEALATFVETRLREVDAGLRRALDRRDLQGAEAHAALSWAAD